MPDSEKHRTNVSRRGFLKGVGAGAAATTLLGAVRDTVAAAAETQAPAVIGPGPVPVALNINGAAHTLELEPRVTLLDALRNYLDLTGSKKVCDRGTCGACTVLLDGKPVYACNILAIEAEGHEITTIEALGKLEDLSELQAAFVEHDGQQCGFCTPGFVVAGTAFLQSHPDADLEAVQQWMGGNFCRCGTYAGITEALLDVAKRAKGGA